MKKFHQIAVLGAAMMLAAPLALAATLTIDSNSGTVTLTAAPSGSGITTPVAAVNLGSTGLAPWLDAVGGSQWVGPEANTAPGGVVAPNGIYTYTSTFSLGAGFAYSGFIDVMADDTTDVYLNGSLITPAALDIAGSHCTVGTPNCVTLSMYLLPSGDFLTGTNTLTFDVHQDFLSATGLDFEGQISPTPEPSSLLMLGSGLLSGAGLLVRRRRQTA
jgi:hypothetical protein